MTLCDAFSMFPPRARAHRGNRLLASLSVIRHSDKRALRTERTYTRGRERLGSALPPMFGAPTPSRVQAREPVRAPYNRGSVSQRFSSCGDWSADDESAVESAVSSLQAPLLAREMRAAVGSATSGRPPVAHPGAS